MKHKLHKGSKGPSHKERQPKNYSGFVDRNVAATNPLTQQWAGDDANPIQGHKLMAGMAGPQDKIPSPFK